MPPGVVSAKVRAIVRQALRAAWPAAEQKDGADLHRLLLALRSGVAGATAEELALQTLVPVERTWRLLHQARARGVVTNEVRRERLVWLATDDAPQRPGRRRAAGKE